MEERTSDRRDNSLTEILGRALDRDSESIERRAREQMPVPDFDEFEVVETDE